MLLGTSAARGFRIHGERAIDLDPIAVAQKPLPGGRHPEYTDSGPIPIDSAIVRVVSRFTECIGDGRRHG